MYSFVIRKRQGKQTGAAAHKSKKDLFEHESMETCHSRDTKCKTEPENEQNVLFKTTSYELLTLATTVAL